MVQDTTTTTTPATPPPPSEQELQDQEDEVVVAVMSSEDLPPLRMHATRGVQRLSGSGPTTTMMIDSESLLKQHHRRGSSGPRSRSRSPSVKNTETTFDAGSSISSLQDLEDLVDPDILLDKAGFEELNPLATQASVKDLQTSVSSLPPVSERLTNDDLEDVHAFSDVTPATKPASNISSQNNSIATGEALALETLDEEDEDEANNNNGRPEVILENMENLELDDHQNSQDEGGEQSVPTA